MGTQIAVIASSGKPVVFEQGVFLLDGAVADVARVIELDALGALQWVNPETRDWAYQVRDGYATVDEASQGPSPMAGSADGPPDALRRFLGARPVLTVLLIVVGIGVLVAMFISLLVPPGVHAVVISVTPELGMATVRDIGDGDTHLATPANGLTVYVGDEVRYEDGTAYGDVKSITAVTKPAQAQ